MKYFLFLCIALTLKAAFMISILLYAEIGLSPDEAQYWTWGQLIDFGYYSKPPGIAAEIWVGTAFFGNTEFGVRFIPLLVGTFLPILNYFLARCCQLSPRASFAAGFMMALTPLGILASLLAITDGGMIFFWILACIAIVYPLAKNERVSYLLVGLCILFGSLFKWPIYLLWLLILMTSVITFQLRSKNIILGMIVSLIGLFPSIYWNMTHEFATFKHVEGTLVGGHQNVDKFGWPLTTLDFLASQAALLSPILLVLLFIALWKLFREWDKVPIGVRFCGSLTFFSLAIGVFGSFFMKMHGNWAIFAYPTGFVLLSWYTFQEGKKRIEWLIAGMVLSIVLNLIVFAIPTLQSTGTTETALKIPYRINPFRQNIGWNHLANALSQARYNPDLDFLFSQTYQTTSILSFYGPKQKRAYFINLTGGRKNQFSFWPSLEQEQIGKTGFFVVIEQAVSADFTSVYTSKLTPYFSQVRFVGAYPLFSAYEKVVKSAFIFECTNYNGLPLPNVHKY